MANYTGAEAAKELGVAPPTIGRLCVRHGIGQKHGNYWLLTSQDVAKLRPLVKPPGNPNFVAGNQFGKPPKKSRKNPRK
jgi:hypothetical protein